MQKIVKQINALESHYQAMSDETLRDQTATLRTRCTAGESLDVLLPDAFAVVREASRRVLQMRHFDVQLLGGIALHRGKIAEMRTGEGKTLVATLPVYLNALTGRGVHVVTVNDYLAKRDASWMGQVYRFLGMTVGVNVPGLSPQEKRDAYAADITYGTNNEFGFDYLRDNMAFSLSDKTQRPLHFAIVDEVDSILIDEARTPLIISGPAEGGAELYEQIHRLLQPLVRQATAVDSAMPDIVSEDEAVPPGDFSVDEKTKQVFLSEAGQERVEQLLRDADLLKSGEGLYDAANISLMYHVNAVLRAQHVFQRDVDYVVKDGEVMIVDEHTGRLMKGRRWSDGLHQAMEAKEGVKVNQEYQTLASITFQNYFRLYDKLAGMTGTADTEAGEFRQIYHLEVVIIPTHLTTKRVDGVDKIYLNQAAKYRAIVAEIQERHAHGQPILVGTASIEASEYLARLLQSAQVPHEVLNAKQHEREAKIIAQAGRPGAVTIATNMAGRGTDIVLGGSLDAELADLNEADEAAVSVLREAWQARHDAVIEAGGLHVLGSERHESRRIDNQLRGRSGRQGDPGSSQFYLSLEDGLMRIFASERAASLMQRFGMKEDEAIEHRVVNRIIENAQRRVEAYHFEIRKQLLQFDDVANAQRKEVYAFRNDYLASEDLDETLLVMVEDVAQTLVASRMPEGSVMEMWDASGLEQDLHAVFALSLPIATWFKDDPHLDPMGVAQRVQEAVSDIWHAQVALLGDQAVHIQRSVLLQCLDMHWKEHLQAMDHLRQGIHLRGYAQKQPIQEFKREALDLFVHLLTQVKREVVGILMHLQVTEASVEALETQRRQANVVPMDCHHDTEVPLLPQAEAEEGNWQDQVGPAGPPTSGDQTVRRDVPKVGRNAPCPCGSGKKYKQCHGRLG